MGSYGECWLGSFYVGSTKNDIDPGLMELFRASDKQVIAATKDEVPRIVRRWARHVEDGEMISTVFYRTSVAVVLDRLDLQGYTLRAAKEAFTISLQAHIRDLEQWRQGPTAFFERELHVLKTANVDDWLEALREIRGSGLEHNFHGSTQDWDGSLRGYMLNNEWYGYQGPDLKVGLRLALEMCSDVDEFVYDVTDLVLSETFDQADDLVAYALGLSASAYVSSGKIIILTEGRSDSRVLATSFELLYPHLADYYSFMDFDAARVGGGAGNLVNLVKAFAAAGIVNRVIALFDNDTAAESALRGFRLLTLPPNIRVLRLPSLDLLRQYPTLGPSGDAMLDVNGIAGSLELYFGIDVLADASGQLTPIQWTGFDATLRQYQGEVTSKDTLHAKFSARMERCLTDRSVMARTDWTGIDAILRQILVAFHDADHAAICQLHRDYHGHQ